MLRDINWQMISVFQSIWECRKQWWSDAKVRFILILHIVTILALVFDLYFNVLLKQ